jgi:glutamate/tyrosine decarboxylase-like PLP-dependent enzyme
MSEDVSDLRERRAPMELSPEEFREAGHELVDAIASFLESLPSRPVNRDETPTEVRALLPSGGLPHRGTDARSLLREIVPILTDHSLLNGHPRFFGYITSSAAPIGALADLLAAAVNPNLGGWQLSPVASEIELQCVRWIAEMIGFPGGCGGLLTSGGNMANFVCFLAARRAKAGPQIRESGVASGSGCLRVYASGGTHTWIQKAADLFGHGTDSIGWIPVDGGSRMDVAALRARIVEDRARGDQPFLIVGTGGSVSTGAVDPLCQIAEVAKEHGLWFHVDGAYGAFAAVLPDAPQDLRAMAHADSIAVDPHKWLYAPLEAGCALVRDPQALPDAFGYKPDYYHFEGEDQDPRVNFYEQGMQNSRGFRALKVWLGLRQVGREGYVKMISDDIRLARELYRLADEHPEIEACTQDLSIATFRYLPSDLVREAGDAGRYLNELNNKLLENLKSSGEAFLSNAVIDDKFVLRACIVNFRTSLADIEALPGIVARHGAELHRRLHG